jgi:hypothetical protein
MSEISLETGRQIGVLINRKGQVEYVMVGNAKQIEMPTSAARVLRPSVFADFDAFTLIFRREAYADDLTDLALLRLDLMSIIQVEKADRIAGNGLLRRIFCRRALRRFMRTEHRFRTNFLNRTFPSQTRYGFHVAYHIARKRNGTRAADGACAGFERRSRDPRRSDRGYIEKPKNRWPS